MKTNVPAAFMKDEEKAAVQECIKQNLDGAQVIRIKQIERDQHDDYWENAYIVAWTRGPMKCGTHRVCINSKGESMAMWGHYFDGHDPSASNAHIDFDRRVAT